MKFLQYIWIVISMVSISVWLVLPIIILAADVRPINYGWTALGIFIIWMINAINSLTLFNLWWERNL